MLYQMRATPIRLFLDNARADERQDVLGHKVIIVGASSMAAAVTITLTGKDGQQVGPLPMQNLDWAEVPFTFDRLGVTNTAQAGDYVDLLVMTFAEPPLNFNYYRQQRGVIDSIANPVPIYKTQGGTLRVTRVVVSNVTSPAVTIVAADATRRSLTIFNEDTVNDITLGITNGVTTASTTAAVLPARGSLQLDTACTGALFGVKGAVSTQLVTVIEELE